MKLAIVCSWLNQYGGAERVLEVVHDMYPQAPLYTSLYVPEALPDAYRAWDIRTSFLNRVPLARRRPQLFLGLFPRAFESLDLHEFDVVLSVTSAFAHGVRTAPGVRHVCYCLTPTRFIWNYEAYVEREGLGRLARLALPPLIGGLRRWDRLAADRVTEFIAISSTVQRRIADHYQRESSIIYPPVRTDYFGAQEAPEDYFLVVSRLVPYKRIDLAVRAFTALGLPLRVIGEGRDRAALQALAGPTVQFLGYQPDDEVRRQMARCRAFVFPGEEDFGITPLEASSAGRPVIAYAAGGALDTVLEGRTGLFFREPTPESLAEAVRRFNPADYAPATLRAHAERFSVAAFQRDLAQVLER